MTATPAVTDAFHMSETLWRRPWAWVDSVLLCIILLFAVCVRAPIIDRPFHRNVEGVGSFYGILARNYLRHGLRETWGVPIQSLGRNDFDAPRLYAHHPPLVPLLVAGSYWMFGEGDWQTRLPSAIFTLLCVVTIYVMVRWRAGTRVAAIAATLFASVPLTILFGGQPDVINAQLVFFILLTVAAYLRFQEKPSVGLLILMSLPFACAAFTDWPAFFIVPVLCLQFVATKPMKQWGWIVAFGLITVALFVAVYAHVSLVTHDWQLVKNQFLRRSVDQETDRFGPFSWVDWMQGVWTHNYKRHTLPVMILAAIWIVMTFVHWRKIEPATTLVRILLGWGLLHALIGRQGVLVHDWWWWPLTPGLCIAAALTLDQMATWIEAHDFHRSAANLAITVLLVIFGATSAVRTIRFFYDDQNVHAGMPYTIDEMGRAIRAAAEPNEAVMIAENDDEPSLWFYADRPIKWRVWDETEFAKRMSDSCADLVFSFHQQWKPAPTAFVFPKQYEGKFAAFLHFLKTNYPQKHERAAIEEKFYTFDLTRPLPLGATTATMPTSMATTQPSLGPPENVGP